MPGRSANHGHWSESKIIASNGYVKVRVGETHPLADPNGYAYEHLVVWCSAGFERPPKTHVIHHRNENKTDNRIENLELKSRYQHSVDHQPSALTDEAVRLMREEFAAGDDTGVLARRYDIPIQTAWKIVRGKTRRAAGGPIQESPLRAGRVLDGRTWDLSPNDKSAIRWAMDELYRLNVELSTWRRESVEEIARLRHELKAQREGMGREIGRLAEACEVANKALSLAWTDLCEWRQFARYNTLGEVCGEPRPIPDPPQRPTKAGLAATELVIGEVMDAIRVVRKLSSPEAHPGPGGEGSHQHTRDCYDDAGPGRGGVPLICGFPGGEGRETD